MANIISIILRAVCLFFLSSFSKALCTWQNSHSTPNDAVMNCMVGKISSAGTPLSTWMFLNCSSAFFGPVEFVAAWVVGGIPPTPDWAFAATITKPDNARKPTVGKTIAPFAFIRSILGCNGESLTERF